MNEQIKYSKTEQMEKQQLGSLWLGFMVESNFFI